MLDNTTANDNCIRSLDTVQISYTPQTKHSCEFTGRRTKALFYFSFKPPLRRNFSRLDYEELRTILRERHVSFPLVYTLH